jgi:branched-chain amino acid transport system ATP-binding protein
VLSHGEKRHLELAIALAANPVLLLLDEPTAGMSPEETDETMDLISELRTGRTIVLVEHKMKLVMKISDRVTVLHQGQILADGTPEEIRANEVVQRTYLGS